MFVFELNSTVRFRCCSLVNPTQSVLADLYDHKADIGAAGVQLTKERMQDFKFSTVHSHDCTVFMTLASTALPK